eukprot:TRINITY_DN16537_c0_g1_i1.p1 TRINITY_DN16537_c0_g1~~TRINITY_DN16537_c0_g1_i1.p1  ORF type:complete len:145 (+),score=50.07 TRINITY_DN16537_c0_g1_i1:2-436(+)
MSRVFFFFQAEDGIRDLVRSRGLGDVYKRQMEDGLVCMIADEDTLSGFLLAGVGSASGQEKSFMICDAETEVYEIEVQFVEFTERDDVAVVMLNQWVAHKIASTLQQYSKPVPAIVVIPAKESRGDVGSAGDPLLARIQGLLAP